MCTRLLLEVSIQVAKAVQLLVLLFMSQETLRPENWFWKVVLSFSLTTEFVALTSLTRWMITHELFFMKQWSSRQYLWPKQVSSVL